MRIGFRLELNLASDFSADAICSQRKDARASTPLDSIRWSRTAKVRIACLNLEWIFRQSDRRARRRCKASNVIGLSNHNGDIDVDPDHGLGRSLLTAIDQLSVTTNHLELKTAPLLLMGFSGAGALVGRLVGFAPDRIEAAIVSHGGQGAPLGLDTISLSGAALKIPVLILVGGKDEIVGTETPYSYFSKHWGRGAPWLFATQNDANHFCNEDATELILAWLNAILDNSGSKRASAVVNKNSGYYAFFRKEPTGLLTNSHVPLMGAVDLRYAQPSEVPPIDAVPAGWLPSRDVALSWERFATLPDHHATVKP